MKITITAFTIASLSMTGGLIAADLTDLTAQFKQQGYNEISIEAHENVIELFAENDDTLRHMLINKDDNRILWEHQEKILPEAQLELLFDAMTAKNGQDEDETLGQIIDALEAGANVDVALRFLNLKYGPFDVIAPMMDKYKDIPTQGLLADLLEELDEGRDKDDHDDEDYKS